jgi:predicted transcriptional regulator
VPLDTTKLRRLNTPKKVVEFASQLRDLLSSVAEHRQIFEDVYDMSDLQALLDDAENKLKEVEEKSQSPLRVSLVGEFSSGKTAALSALLKMPRILPSSQAPTSGNVVEVQIVPAESDVNSDIVRCVLFSPLELEDMLQDYYSWLGHKFKGFEQPEGNFLQGERFLRQNINFLVSNAREQLKNAWMKQKQGDKAASHNFVKSLAHLYRILYTIRPYLEQYPTLKTAEPLELSVTLAGLSSQEVQKRLKTVAMLSMAQSNDELLPDKIEQEVEQFWQSLPTPLENLQDYCQTGTISSEALRALFPLYKRIVLFKKMELSKDWKDTDRIALLDFPGVGSGNRRDAYLCTKELSAAHVNILFFIAKRPKDDDAQELFEIIVDAKKESRDLGERIIPVINFFEEYDGKPEDITDDTGESESALRRVERFFETQLATGVKAGFNVFDQAIVGNLNLGGNWRYHLLTPAVTQKPLSEGEKGAYDDFQKDKARYGQLSTDLKVAIRYLKKTDRVAYKEQIQKDERLFEALHYYLQDGGISGLREQLVAKLKKKGQRLIAEDARAPLRELLEQLETVVISPLAIEVVDDDDIGGDQPIIYAEARGEIVQLWRRMTEVLQEWEISREKAKLEYETSAGQFADLLKVCEDEVLDRVLRDEFWTHLVDDAPEPIELQKLEASYQAMMSDLDTWKQQALIKAIKASLTRMEMQELTHNKVSLRELKNDLFDKYVKNVPPEKVAQEEAAFLKEVFSLVSLAEAIHAGMEGKRQAEHTLGNPKRPFNENLWLNWTAQEIMKLHRQLIITLQRHIADYFAFFKASFFNELQALLKTRQREVHQKFIAYDAQGGLFDQLATVDTTDPEDLTFMERREKAAAAINEILEEWDKLIQEMG